MHMTRKEASRILNVSEGASKEEIKQVYAKIALTTHPDQKTSTPESTEIFERVSMAYKRLQQPAHKNWVELSTLMEQFSTVFRFRMKTENGYVYFMYNPFTGLPDSDSDYDDDDNYHPNGLNNLALSKLKSNLKLSNHKKIVEVDPGKFKEMQANANKNAEELIIQEDKAKEKAKRKREKRLRQKEKKKNQKKISGDINSEYSNGNSKRSSITFNEKGDSAINSDSESSGSVNYNLRKDASNKGIVIGVKGTNISGEVFIDPKAHQRTTQSRKLKKQAPKTNNVKNGKARKDSDSSDDSEGDENSDNELDEASAFVAKAVKNVGLSQRKVRKEPTIKSEIANENVPAPQQQEKARDVIALSRQFAMQGNQLASNNKYDEAAKLFTQAISLFNTDCRYYGNRSYCYDRMELYEKALRDAETAIKLSSLWAKGYFRKGRALTGLERYVEAEQAYEEVLKLDRQCFDAEQELTFVRLKHLMDMGFSKEQCEAALKKWNTIALALEQLLGSEMDGVNIKDGNASENASDDEEEFIQAKFKRKHPVPSSATPPHQHQQQSQTTNNEGYSEVDYNSLWIGNLTYKVSEQALWSYFSQFGKISDVTAMYERRCAFVNFISTDAAKTALSLDDTVNICGESLVIRYPDRAFTQIPRISYKSKRECFYWRNRGCHFGSACRYLHVEANKGIDLHTVERSPYQSTIQY